MKVSHIFLVALFAMTSANSLFAKQNGGGNRTKGESQYTFGIKYPKTGGFIGGEFGFGGAASDIAWYRSGVNQNVAGAYNYDYVVVPLNVFGGYQWYFYDRPHYMFGVRVRGHFGYTNYNAKLQRWINTNANNVSLTSNAIQYGAEAQIIWDFFDYEAHTLGMHFAPLGFEGSTFFGEAKYDGGSEYLGSHTKFAFTASLGLHYYYAINHQVYATYKYRTYSHLFSAEKYYSVANHTFMLGYAYKF